MCESYGITYKKFLKRKKLGWTLGEILGAEERKLHRVSRTGNACEDHLGNKFKSRAEMCRYHNVSFSTYSERIKAGHSVKEALTGEVYTTATDHKGIKYRSHANMCKQYGIAVNTYNNRIAKGWTVEEALLTPTKYRNRSRNDKGATDHLGNKFSSVSEMCDEWGINLNTYKARIQAGWDVKRALLTPSFSRDTRSIDDHLGNHYSSLSEMAKQYGIDPGTLRNRIDHGWSIKDALTKPVQRNVSKLSIIKDHLGNEYKSMNDMCKHYNIVEKTFVGRIGRGMSLEDALTKPIDTSKSSYIECKDHLGNEYKSLSAMCRAYGITVSLYRARLKSGWDLETALTVSKTRKVCKDHLGNEFASIAEMLEYWGVNRSTYYKLLSSGKKFKEIAEQYGKKDGVQ